MRFYVIILYMKKYLVLAIFLFTFFVGVNIVNADNNVTTFKAKVLKVLDQKELVREDGSKNLQQDLLLKPLDGKYKDQEVTYHGIGDIDVINNTVYRDGDKVLAMASENDTGEVTFFVTDYVRQSYLIWLIVLLTLIVVGVASWKGLKALISLVITFAVIFGVIIPPILKGYSPILFSFIGAVLIIIAIVYVTEGFNRRSHIAVASIAITLVITAGLATFFTYFGRLTGSNDEEVMYLIGVGKGVIDFKGLLFAGMMIATLGALDDGVISQIQTVNELKRANPKLPPMEIYKRAMEVGTSHIGSMINTLFLAYAGASMPLLMLFALRQEPFIKISQVINNEMIATEIVRTFVCSIGLTIGIPIATFLAVKYLKLENKNKNN